jgi:transcriptional regulator with XRE-family HTH domain
MNDSIEKRIGARIRAARVQQGMTAAQVAECIGVSYGQFWKYEVAKSTISARTLAEIAELLSTPISFFFEEVALPADMLSSQSGRIALLSTYNRLDEAGRALLISIARSIVEAGDSQQLAAQ